jgi:hypothetical protein
MFTQLEVDWTCTQDEKGKTTKTSAEMDTAKGREVEAYPRIHGKEPMRQTEKMKIGQTLR